MFSGLLALEVQQKGTDFRDGGHLGGQTGNFMLPDGGGDILPFQEHTLFAGWAVVHYNIQTVQQRNHLGRVSGIRIGPQSL